jgi:protein SCO1/2
MRRTMAIGFVVALTVFLPLAACKSPLDGKSASFRGNVLATPMPAPDFTLTDQYDHLFRLSDQKGRVVILFFGYASCPDVCPTTLSVWKQVHEALGDDAHQVRFVFVTVDPERDTKERLKVHLDLFNSDFIGLTGTEAELEAVYRAYGVYREKVTLSDSALGYQVTHTSSGYVIDPDGAWRLRHPFGTPVEDIVHDIRQLVK